MKPDPNVEMVQLAAEGLGPLVDEVVFLGGSAAGLLITDPAAPTIRETNDVDVIVEVGSLHDYHRLSDQLRAQGFREDQSEGAPMCRWLYGSVVVDVMPTESSILGFGNRWYLDAMHASEQVHLPNGKDIRLVTAPYFLATKLEAFYGRGKGDYMASHDLEDFIAVIDGRATIAEEIDPSSAVGHYLANECGRLMRLTAFLDAIPCHLPADAASQQRADIVLRRLGGIANLRGR